MTYDPKAEVGCSYCTPKAYREESAKGLFVMCPTCLRRLRAAARGALDALDAAEARAERLAEALACIVSQIEHFDQPTDAAMRDARAALAEEPQR